MRAHWKERCLCVEVNDREANNEKHHSSLQRNVRRGGTTRVALVKVIQIRLEREQVVSLRPAHLSTFVSTLRDHESTQVSRSRFFDVVSNSRVMS